MKRNQRVGGSTTDAVNYHYDESMFEPVRDQLYEGSDFRNLGYWREGTAGQQQACENLVDELVEMLPSRDGTLLDVACGKGATTAYLGNYFDPATLTGINISERQIERCREVAPQSTFLVMDAVELEFESESFDNVVCVEAAFHFNTREAFLNEVFRVLRPGGGLAVSDVIDPQLKRRKLTPPANRIADEDAYRALWEGVGFVDVDVTNATEVCRHGFYRNLLRFVKAQVDAGAVDEERLTRTRKLAVAAKRRPGAYVLARGIKPTGD